MRNIIFLTLSALCLSAVIAQDSNQEILISRGLVDYTDADLLSIYQSYGYEPDPNSERFQLFKSRLAKIIEHNSNPDKKYSQIINKLTFQTDLELKKFRASQNCSATAQANTRSFRKYDLSQLPQYVDWREKGVVTQVKSQGKDCGSCWAFAAVAALESHYALKTGKKPIQFSEQQLVDCARKFDTKGCSGGLPSKGFEYLAYAGGIQNEADYPYEGEDKNCRFNSSKTVVQVQKSYNITFQDENELIYHLANYGPVTIAYQVNSDFDNYKNGVFTSSNCSKDPEDVNHAVLAVGYNMTGKYFIAKNSWGNDWGMNGYFYIELGSNMCGLADCASYPIIGEEVNNNDNDEADKHD
ncbi:papain family cysteine protease (macronuclear) [Tetrahymena thermophila SB210]|uniref:Papain family cysteine protease n=1 Tax=Tetrahymena thermophila (strain SB210) TaxID=312017 RepID=Q23TW3_TETTS|nr:papain family cysteine protease [Tetrahymena thermophila SB210]EAR99932.3 papain family cysteine protease [Tetrahymena thermophila SB210]|eukprot:XP_001020177.3 papain family cysteine protease [Tetrahymena thermophila SB210]